ncbi:MAG TPA: VWA domain-containing protein [Bacteroidales bacterium]|mgnify:CR=1 FL=1|nr:VWA domain-containing protein [Bacteroidales bacterium]
MRLSVFKKIIIIYTLAFSSGYVVAQVTITEKEKPLPKPVTRILFVYDASQSMIGVWQSDRKISIASKLMSQLLDSLKNVENLHLGLRIYGHQKYYPPQDCDDTRLEIPLGTGNTDKIKNKLKTVNPRGTTPIAASLEAAGNDFPPCDHCRNIIILITDGLEECGGDPCAVSQALQKKGVVLKPFIIGIGRNFKESFDCVGTYYDASTEKEFSKALNVVISQALNSTTAQINLLDTYGKPTETNVGMTLYDNFSGTIKYNFIHTFNDLGLPDTLMLDPLLAYDLVVHTIPPVRHDSITITPGKHTTIAASTPQGTLELKVGGKLPSVKNLQCIVRQGGKMETLNVQTFDQKTKYLIGKYDLEVLSLPRMYINDVEIKQSYNTTVEIPMPGIAIIQLSMRGYGDLYVEENNELKWIYKFNEEGQQEMLYVLPGKYRIIFRSKYATHSVYTFDKTFKIESGVTTRVNFY